VTYTATETTLGVVLFHRVVVARLLPDVLAVLEALQDLTLLLLGVVVARLLPDVLAALEALQDLTLLLLDWLAWGASILRGKEYGASPLVVLLGEQAIAVRANHV
jgi:hypothetical protein